MGPCVWNTCTESRTQGKEQVEARNEGKVHTSARKPMHAHIRIIRADVAFWPYEQ